MNKLLGVAVLAFGAGYICGHATCTNKYKKWQEEHKFKCWMPRETPEGPGDYPRVFVIDKRGAK